MGSVGAATLDGVEAAGYGVPGDWEALARKGEWPRGGRDKHCLGWFAGLAVQKVAAIVQYKMKRGLMIAMMAVPCFFGQLCCAPPSPR